MTEAEKKAIAEVDAKIDALLEQAAQLGAELKVQREMIDGVNATVNETHTMGAEMKRTYETQIVPLLTLAQNHPLAKLALRKAGRRG